MSDPIFSPSSNDDEETNAQRERDAKESGSVLPAPAVSVKEQKDEKDGKSESVPAPATSRLLSPLASPLSPGASTSPKPAVKADLHASFIGFQEKIRYTRRAIQLLQQQVEETKAELKAGEEDKRDAEKIYNDELGEPNLHRDVLLFVLSRCLPHFCISFVIRCTSQV